MIDHLSEAERQMAADGSVPPDRQAAIEGHLGACDDCAADVARLSAVVARARALHEPTIDLDRFWPDIRARIDAGKTLPLRQATNVPKQRRRRLWALAPIAAAVVLAVWLGARARGRGDAGQPPMHAMPTDIVLTSSADSAQMYAEQAKLLLARLELQRAMLRPEAVAAMDHDLKVIDSAIAEVQIAIERDPKNPALRHLLVASYRQKVEILERAGNAG